VKSFDSCNRENPAKNNKIAKLKQYKQSKVQYSIDGSLIAPNAQTYHSVFSSNFLFESIPNTNYIATIIIKTCVQ
jgi:hypothetical protein